jgi:hypothetical protein
MVRALEEAGVGRPSTYAPTLKLLVDRRYVAKEVRSCLGGRFLGACGRVGLDVCPFSTLCCVRE